MSCGAAFGGSRIQVGPQPMPRNARDALNHQHALCRDLLPLSNCLWRNRLVQRAGKPRIATDGLFRFRERSGFQFSYSSSIAHAELKAQLSQKCKYLFR